MSIAKNTAFNLSGALAPLAVGLVIVPHYLSAIGEARFGILTISWLLLGYFNLFELGLGRATAQRVAALGDKTECVKASFWTALSMNTGLGLVGALLLWPVTVACFTHVLSIEQTLRPEIIDAAPWLALGVPFATISSVLSGALLGKGKFFHLNAVSVSNSVLVQVVPLLTALINGPNLGILIMSALAARCSSMVLLLLLCKKFVFLDLRPALSKREGAALLRYGGWVTITAIVGPLMVILDRFLIGALLGSKAVTFYTIPFQFGERTTVLSGALSGALFPKLANFTPTQAAEAAKQAMLSLAVLLTPLMVLAILCMKPFLKVWIGPQLAEQSGSISAVLFCGFWINSFALIAYVQLQATGRPDLVARCHLLELVPYLLALSGGMFLFGVFGAALTFSLRAAVDAVLLLRFARLGRAAIVHLRRPAGIILATAAMDIALPDFAALRGCVLLATMAFTLHWAWRAAPLDMRISAQQTLYMQVKKWRDPENRMS